jgi:hypothetical protein
MNINDNKLILILLVISVILNYISVKKSNEYESDKSIFCGIKKLPTGYTRYGNRYECLKRGFGAGKYINEITYPFRKFGFYIVIISIGIICYQFYKNNNKDDNNKDNIKL